MTNGEITGFGTFTFSQNDTLERESYRGEMVGGELNGLGSLYYKDNQIYIGEVIDGQPQGSGSLINKLGIEIKKGIWENGYYTNNGKSVKDSHCYVILTITYTLDIFSHNIAILRKKDITIFDTFKQKVSICQPR